MRITIENLTKKYGDRTIFSIDDLIFEEGKIMGITGPNGAGKTTLLNIIGGIDSEYNGKVFYDGKKLDNEIKRNMTYLFQKPYLFRRSVYENIIYPLKLRNYSNDDIDMLANNIMKNLEIEDLKDLKAHKLSGGESQKVALARALVFRPKLLLLDEPTSNIDPDSIKILEREILKFNKETGATVIIITHNMKQTERMCNSVVYLCNGKVGV